MQLTLTIHPRCGDPVEVLRRFGPDAVWIEFADGQVTIVPRTWTSLVPRAAPMSHGGLGPVPRRQAPDLIAQSPGILDERQIATSARSGRSSTRIPRSATSVLASSLLVQQLLDPAQRAAQGLGFGTGAAQRQRGLKLGSDGIRYVL